MQMLAIWVVFLSALTISQSHAQSEAVVYHYRFDEPEDAEVFMKNGTTTSIRLNYNLIMEEMVLDLGHTQAPYSNTDQVEKIVITDITFLCRDKVFYEVIEDSEVPLLIRRQRKLIRPGEQTGYGQKSQTSAVTTTLQRDLYNPDIAYNKHLPDAYTVEENDSYYWLKDEQLIELKSIRKALKEIPEVEAELKPFSKQIQSADKSDLIKLTKKLNELLSSG